MRSIALDSETTGGSAKVDGRIVEIGMVELINFVPTGKILHGFFNPRRKIDFFAQKVHGLSFDMLKGCPDFSERAEEISDFVKGDLVYAHNAKLDHSFVRAEFLRAGLIHLEPKNWRDTVKMCQSIWPGQSCKLDAVAGRYGLKGAERQKHGALHDAAILAAILAKIHKKPDVDIDYLVSLETPRSSLTASAADFSL